MKNRKVVLVGCGAVGMSFLYGALNQCLFDEYVLIDAFENASKGNAIDCEDAILHLPQSPKYVRSSNDYSECRDADIVVITAGVAQKPGETRLELINRNAKIMYDIATAIKESGFDGISIVASNPVDILTTLYQKITNFDVNKVIGTGTCLDSMRLNRLIAEKYEVYHKDVVAYVVGEHGDSSVSAFSNVTIGGMHIDKYAKPLTVSQKQKIHKDVMTMAYKIINLKRATFYGIGSAINRICRAVLHDENSILPISCVTKNSLGMQLGWPATINKNGWSNPLKLELSAEEKKGFNHSAKEMKKVFDKAVEELNL